MTRGADPLGKRALFGPPPDVVAEAVAATAPDSVVDPFAPSSHRRRDGLFSEAQDTPAPPAPGPGRTVATVTCRSCGSRTTLGAIGLAVRLMTSVWIPGRRWNRYLRCPACGRLAWGRIRWGG